ncbi:helix-turn-helix domain-containing protein [Flectobacillus roseus]|uniref:AraC family transcriptional regulator n=1 Tax=Flectobacillus roseus TaxID=502259 RepID=A0ABT6YG20_9BACT|nr:AraC family transcriptional regulator [Flectobacillus roseus]MDI9862529.1 AraC family transcriptional regulator [Flectobacillus roseus]
MKRYILHTAFNIYHFEATQWEHSVHKHTYFEIIFILKGQGQHNLNGNSYDYSEGDVFLVGPEDFHDFEIATLTEFCFIRFNESFLKHSTQEGNTWQKIVDSLLYTSSQSRGSIVHELSEKQKLHHLLYVLESEYQRPESQYFEIIRDNLMRSIMVILARNLLGQSASPIATNDSVEAILRYIKQHIYEPSLLTIEHLAEVFHYSPAYISIFFKRHTGEPLKQYITKLKMSLIEARLQYSQHSLTEIADEFGFTDESHFCKQFRKYTGKTPTAFRKKRTNST